MNLQLASRYRQTTTELQFLTMDEQPGNEQGQQLRGRRGVKMYDGRVQSQNRGRGQGHRRMSDEIRATIVDHVVNHGLTMSEPGRWVQPNIERSTMSSKMQSFCRENRYVHQRTVILYTYCNASYYSTSLVFTAYSKYTLYRYILQHTNTQVCMF